MTGNHDPSLHPASRWGIWCLPPLRPTGRIWPRFIDTSLRSAAATVFGTDIGSSFVQKFGHREHIGVIFSIRFLGQLRSPILIHANMKDTLQKAISLYIFQVRSEDLWFLDVFGISPLTPVDWGNTYRVMPTWGWRLFQRRCLRLCRRAVPLKVWPRQCLWLTRQVLGAVSDGFVNFRCNFM